MTVTPNIQYTAYHISNLNNNIPKDDLPIGRISLNAQVAVEASAPLKAPTSLMCGMKATPAVPQQAALRIIGLAQLKGTMTDL